MSTEDRRREAVAAVEATREVVEERASQATTTSPRPTKGLPSLFGARYAHDAHPAGYVAPPEDTD